MRARRWIPGRGALEGILGREVVEFVFTYMEGFIRGDRFSCNGNKAMQSSDCRWVRLEVTDR